MIAVVFVLAILVVALIWRNIVNEIRVNDLRGDHNALRGTVDMQSRAIKLIRESPPDPDRERMIICLLDLMHPRKYPDFYSFTDADGRHSYIVSTYITYDKDYPFQEKSFSRHYTYIIQGPLACAGNLTVSESYLDTIAKVREQTLKECEEKLPCKRNPRSKKSSDDKKKGGNKS